MGTILEEDFIERRCYPVTTIHPGWQLHPRGNYYELDLKMCQLKSLNYNFTWGTEIEPLPRMSSVTESPSMIVKLDLSLNELTALEHEGLQPFKNLRDLNASLNRIHKFIGIEVLRHLHSLNLSHNDIKKIDNLVQSNSLVELNLSMNELQDISYMPSLINLEVLNLNNNKLRSLDGVQSLPHLKEIYAQRNELVDIVPLTSCFRLQVVNVAENHIETLNNTADILGQLKRLDVLSLYGNPIERDRMYRTELLKCTNVMTLDNISVRPLPKQPETPVNLQFDGDYKHKQNIHSLKEAAKQAFEERMRDSKIRMADQVSFLQKRIIELQNENRDYEEKLKTDLEACLRYLDSLTDAEATKVDRRTVRDTMGTPLPKPWHKSRASRRDRTDYSGIKDTDLVLNYAKSELAKEQQ